MYVDKIINLRRDKCRALLRNSVQLVQVEKYEQVKHNSFYQPRN